MELSTRLKHSLVLLLLPLALSACGGSGGSSGSTGQLNVPTTAINTPTITIAKPVLQFSEATNVSVTFKKSDGTPASGFTVNFTTTLGTLASNGIAITDANGTATIGLTAGATPGQGQVTASATINNKLVAPTVLFSVNLPALKLANLTLTGNPSGAIDFGSSQGVSVDVQDANGNPFTTQPVDVIFTSTQAASGKATINSPVTSVNGKASTTYTAVSATGTDTITATIAGSSVTVNLTVNPLSAGSITFVSAAPTNIGLKNMGGVGIQETSVVTFKVVDTSGAPKANQPVVFVLNTTVGGLSLSANSGSTDAQGKVSTIVQAGLVSTPVRVTASTTVGLTVLSTQSDQLVISTGIPAQNGMSLAVVNRNVEALNIDGISDIFTVFLADHFGNPVPDGTAVNFSAQVGQIQPSCTTVNGRCTATWTSSGTRTADGRVAVLAYAIGEETFVDKNGSGVADGSGQAACLAAGSLTGEVTCGEFIDTPQAWRDDAHTTVYSPVDPFIDFNGTGTVNRDGIFNGILRPNSVVGTKTKHVFKNNVIVMASSAALISSSPATINAPKAFDVTVTDVNGNTMPSGTTIVVTAPFGVLSGNTSFTVPQNTGSGVTLNVFISVSATPKAQDGLITVKVTSPSGLVTNLFIPISGVF